MLHSPEIVNTNGCVLKLPPDYRQQYKPEGDCCEQVIATAFNSFSGQDITTGYLVSMGHPNNRFGAMRMAEWLNRGPYKGTRNFYVEPLSIYPVKKSVENRFVQYLSQGELIYLVVYIQKWLKHVLKEGPWGNEMRHAVLIHGFTTSQTDTQFHVFDPAVHKSFATSLNDFWPSLFLSSGIGGELDKLIGLETVEFAVLGYT